jgi:hypothetical protein
LRARGVRYVSDTVGGVSAGRLRALTVALLVAAAVLGAFAGDEGGPVFAASVACFLAAVAVFLRWRRALRASVFDREEKTPSPPPDT